MHNFRLLQHEHDKVTCSDHDGCHSEWPCYISEYIFLISHQDLDMPCLIYHFLNKIISKKGITNCFSIELRNLVYWIFKNRAGIDCTSNFINTDWAAKCVEACSENSRNCADHITVNFVEIIYNR